MLSGTLKTEDSKASVHGYFVYRYEIGSKSRNHIFSESFGNDKSYLGLQREILTQITQGPLIFEICFELEKYENVLLQL